MQKLFRLEVVFHSDAVPVDPGRPVAMAYAFTDWSGDLADAPAPDAQNLRLLSKTVPKGSFVMFDVFDTATYPAGKAPPEISEVTINCAKANTTTGDSPFVALPGEPQSLNKWWVDKNTVTAKPEASDALPLSAWPGELHHGVGCNVKGRHWTVGPFAAHKVGDYELTLTVKLNDGRKFEVDPEMEVREGNG